MWPLMSSPRMSRRLLLGVGGILGELDAAGLAAAAGQHLRLDDDRAAERRAAARASSGESARRPSETGMPTRRKSSLPWYS